MKKQFIIFEPKAGDKLSFRNANLIIKDKDGKSKYQVSCFRVFSLLVIGECSVTTGLMRMSVKYKFSICFMSYSFRFHTVINHTFEGNTRLHKRQYEQNCLAAGKCIIRNKISNQRALISNMRNKNAFIKDGITILDNCIASVGHNLQDLHKLLAIEGNASKTYFRRMFDTFEWKGRKPRIKFDYINC